MINTNTRRREIKTYKLSLYGRKLTWETWKTIGGCGIPNCTSAYHSLGPQSKWENIMLGDIEDACPFTGRSLARFAIERLKLNELVDIIG